MKGFKIKILWLDNLTNISENNHIFEHIKENTDWTITFAHDFISGVEELKYNKYDLIIISETFSKNAFDLSNNIVNIGIGFHFIKNWEKKGRNWNSFYETPFIYVLDRSVPSELKNNWMILEMPLNVEETLYKIKKAANIK